MLRQSWVTRDNVNQLVHDAGFSGDIDVLTIDLDGVDYWIWEALENVRAGSSSSSTTPAGARTTP